MRSHDMLAAVDRFLDHLAHDRALAPRTITSYGADLAAFCDFLARSGVAADVRAVAHEHLVAWLREPAAGGARRSPRSRNRRLAVLRGFFRHVGTERLREDDPTVGIPWSKVRPGTPPSVSPEDIRKIVEAARAARDAWLASRDEALLVLLVQTGLRLHEAVSLDVGQVDFEGAALRQVLRKGGARRDLVVNREVLRVLEAWLPNRARRAGAEEPALFLSRERARLSPRSVQRIVHHYAAVAGVSGVRVHALRHAFGYHVQQLAGATMRTAQELLNHADIKTTALYSRSHERDQREALARMEALTEPRGQAAEADGGTPQGPPPESTKKKR